MSDSKTQYLHKGARVINAAINELDLPDELKETAQRVVTLFATDLLPGLLLRKPEGAAPRPGAGGPPPQPATPADPTPEQVAELRQQVRRLVLCDDDDEAEAPKQADISSPRQNPATERQVDVPPPRQEPEKEPVWDSDTIKMVHSSLEILRRTHENQIRLVNEAFIAAAKRGADPMDMLEVLLHAATYCREDPTVPTLAELTSQATRRDVH
jgi:hypothetical protein